MITTTPSFIIITVILDILLPKTASALNLFGYKPPKVWKFKPQKGTWGSVNRPTAGPRPDAAKNTTSTLSSLQLPRGEHNIQLYSLGTPNGMKVTCLLEELNLLYGVEYDAWRIGIGAKEQQQFHVRFVEVNPNSKIPALLHYSSPSDTTTTTPIATPTRVFESSAILLYLCGIYDTKNTLFPSSKTNHNLYAECLSWLFWTHGSAPYLGGGFGHFYHYAPIKIRYAIDRYTMETKRQLDVLERHLSGKVFDGEQDDGAQIKEQKSVFAGGPYLCGNVFTVADIACYPWYGRLVEGKIYGKAAEFLRVEEEYPSAVAWAKRVGERKGVRRGCMVNRDRGDKGLGVLRERHHSRDFEEL